MSNEMYGQQSGQQMIANQMRGNLNPLPQWGQQQYAICTKHDQPIDMFCMSHNKALCQQCVSEHQRAMMHNVGVPNAPSDQMARNCQLKFTDQAIKESTTRMHVSLRSVQEFIKKKESIDQIENPGMRQIYLEQNRIFEMSYNVAHDLLTRIQSMTPAEKVISLEPFNMRFQEKFAQLQNTSQYMEQIIQQMQSQQISGQNRSAIDQMQQQPSSSATYYAQQQQQQTQSNDIPSYMGSQQQQEQIMRQHQKSLLASQQNQQDFRYYQQQQQQQLQEAQAHHAPNAPLQQQAQQQPIYHQLQAGRPQQNSAALTSNPENPQPAATTPQNQAANAAAAFNGQGPNFPQVAPQAQQAVPHPGQGPAHPKLPAPGQTGAQFAAGYGQANPQKALQSSDVDSAAADLVNKQRKMAEQGRTAQNLDLETSGSQQQAPYNAMSRPPQPAGYPQQQPTQQAQPPQPAQQPPRQVYPAAQQPPFVPGYKLKHHQGIQLFVTVEIEDRHLKQRNPPNQTSNIDPKCPSAKQIEFEIELDSSWTLKDFSRKVKEDIMRSQLAVRDQGVIDKLLFYNADRVIGTNGQTVMHSFYNELKNQTTPLGEQNIAPGSQIIVTTLQKVNPPQTFVPNGPGRSPDRRGAYYGADGQRVYGNPMGSPSVNPANGKDGTLNGTGVNGQGTGGQYIGDSAHQMMGGRPPPLKHVPQRPPGAQNSEAVKKPAKTGMGPRQPRELDPNGQPIKKMRTKRPPRPIEEVSIYFRVRSLKEKLEQQQADAGFQPTPAQSDNEGDDNAQGDKEEGADGNAEEQMKDDNVAGAAADDQQQQPEESKQAPPQAPAQLNAAEEKIFDRMIKVKPKSKLKGIRKQLLEELGVQDICTARIYSVKSALDEPVEEEHKDEAQEKEDQENEKEEAAPSGEGNEELVGEMASLETLGLANGGKLEVEVYFTVEVQVQGKGAGYNNKVEVGPEELMDVIEDRVSFFRMFKQRGFEIYAPEIDRIFEVSDMTTTLFRDSGLKNGSKLVLCEPSKRVADSDEENEASDVDAEGGESEMMEEGGEDEQDEMNEESEAEQDDAGEAAEGDDENEDEDNVEKEMVDDDEGEEDDAEEGSQKEAPLGLQLPSQQQQSETDLIRNQEAGSGEQQPADASKNNEYGAAAAAGTAGQQEQEQ